MDRSRLNIGTYYLRPYACTDEHIRDLKECGIDFVVCMQNDRDHLDLLDRYGIGAIVSGIVPSSFLTDTYGDAAKREYNKAVNSFIDHPSVWGVDCGDEPSSTEFKRYGDIIKSVGNDFHNKIPYVNLCPNYGILATCTPEERYSQLGTGDYDEYIERFCESVGTDYICYDFYLYSCNVNKAYENLCTVSDACRRYGRSMWIVLQVNSHLPESFISENMLRFQGFSAMAFGAENITWACYTAGWWYNQVLDEKGNKTEQYEKLKKVNGEIRALSHEYMKYKCVKTHFIGFSDHDLPKGTKCSEPCRNISLSGEGKLLAGEMVLRNGTSKALFIVGADDPYDKNGCKTVFTLKSEGAVKVLRSDGKIYDIPSQNGACSVEIMSNEAVMILNI